MEAFSLKHTKILFALMLSISLFLVACGNDNNENNENTAEPNEEELANLNETGFPVVDENITLNIFAQHDPATNEDWNDVYIFNEYEDMTNIDIDWRMVHSESANEQVNLTLVGGDLPDAFHSTLMGSGDLMKHGEQGSFLPLNDLIDEYAPNFKALMEENPTIAESITMPDGNIYAFPTLGEADFLAYRTAPMLYIQEEWLDELDMDMPETTEEFYQYLKAVKDENPSGGDQDDIPFGAPTANHLYNALRGSFAIATKGGDSANIDLDPESGDYRFYPTSDSYKEILEYMNKLFNEGLIPENIYSQEHDQFLADAGAGRYGSTVWYSPTTVMGEEVGSKYTGMPTLEGPHGDKVNINLGSMVKNMTGLVITNANEHPEATVRWVDYFYGEEGSEFFFMGKEGDTFEYNEDGEPEYSDKVMEDTDASFSEQVSQYFTFPGGGSPTMIMQQSFRGAESSDISIEAAKMIEDDLIEGPWPAILHTEEENKQLQGFGADIEKYVDEMRDKFIAGEEPFSKWDDYVGELEKMGIDDYMELKQEALERQLDQ